MKSWRIIAVLLLCLVLASCLACNPFGSKQEEASQQLVKVVRGDLTVSVSGSGNIEVSNEAKLTFGIVGKIDKIYVEEGDNVIEGDVLAKLDTDALELALTQAKLDVGASELALTQAQLDVSASELALTQAQLDVDASELALTQAKFDVGASEVALTQAELALKKSEYNLRKLRSRILMSKILLMQRLL